MRVVTIYTDVLITINFIIDVLILRLCAFLSGVGQRPVRRYLAALIGGISSLLIFLPIHGFWLDLLSRMATSMVMVAVAYGHQKPRVFGKLLLIFYGVSFLVAGFVMGLWLLLPPGLVSTYRGIVYFNLKPVVLVGSVIAAYGFVNLFNRIFYWRQSAQEIYSITIWRKGYKASFSALADTGNRLVEPFSGQPLVVVGLETIIPLLSGEEAEYIRRDCLDDRMPATLRLAAYHAVGGRGILKAFRPDRITVNTKDGEREIGAYVAVSSQRIGNETYSGVFHPKLIQILT